MSEGIYTLAGAVVGGLVGVLGTIGAARVTGRDQRRNQHEQWRRQLRRDAYSLFLIRAGAALRAANTAHEAARTDASDVYQGFDELKAACGQLEEAATLVTLEGPEPIADAAMNAYFRIGAWKNALHAAHSGPPELRDAAWGRALQANNDSEQCVEKFGPLCRELLDQS
ncbi:hypothetical protein [Streptomyces sp. NPDC058398]|uniref:hypothetical protein n=1 Tax=Streptomyces sp. NPDC058398 TaxID=3346479 RepID=UPI00365C8069